MKDAEVKGIKEMREKERKGELEALKEGRKRKNRKGGEKEEQ